MRGLLLSLAVAGAMAAVGSVAQAAVDPAASRVEELCKGVLQAAKQTSGASLQVRAQHMRPLIDQNFDLGSMARFAVGEPWSKWTPADRASVEAALTRYTAARYASELDAYRGQQCEVDPAVVTRGPDKLVKSKIVGGGESSSVNYRLREANGGWKVIDVYYDGVSQLATQRADFAEVVRAKGAPGLAAKLSELTARMR